MFDKTSNVCVSLIIKIMAHYLIVQVNKTLQPHNKYLHENTRD